jgi:CHAT domain-containing protein
MNDGQTGVLQLLGKPASAASATDKLAALWRVLVPADVRKALTGGTAKRLIVVPDGPLALLPFETLVVRSGRSAQYLLDAGPPVLYGPSAAVLYNLAARTPSKRSEREPVLTVGNPAYGRGTTQAASVGPGVLGDLGSRSRYGAVGGKLLPLPYSGLESKWVADAFNNQGLTAVRLEGPQATKANLKSLLAGRRVVHLACHGLTDDAYGNFFGALALTPGPHPNDASDDGFLTLAEIYQLNLKGCDLAILSACETNYGPQQQGEGVWALSRGFLVAGARRVVASNWLVDDEAAATLINYFCGCLAEAEKKGGPADYAEALRKAKRAVRQQDKWKDPYYWGTFVLVGPS